MSHPSLFDVAGPIMVGPSSSHTAGACKIGQFARAFFDGTPKKVTFYLHGSFGTVYQGHATDKALLAGVMKMHAKDARLPKSFEIAEKKKIAFEFIPKDLGPEHHPNTVRIVMENKGRKVSVTGSSIGGGKVKISHLNDMAVDIEAIIGRYHSLLISHDNKPGVLGMALEKIMGWGYPLVGQQTCVHGKTALTFLNIEEDNLSIPQVQELEDLPGVDYVRGLAKLIK